MSSGHETPIYVAFRGPAVYVFCVFSRYGSKDAYLGGILRGHTCVGGIIRGHTENRGMLMCDFEAVDSMRHHRRLLRWYPLGTKRQLLLLLLVALALPFCVCLCLFAVDGYSTKSSV